MVYTSDALNQLIQLRAKHRPPELPPCPVHSPCQWAQKGTDGFFYCLPGCTATEVPHDGHGNAYRRVIWPPTRTRVVMRQR